MSLERLDEVQPQTLEMYFMIYGHFFIIPYLEDACFMMDSLSMIQPGIEDGTLLVWFHDLDILHDGSFIFPITLYGAIFYMVLMMLGRVHTR